MNNKLRVFVLAAALSLPAASALQAQIQFGAQVNFADDAEFGVGARVRHSLTSLFPRAPLSGIGSIDFYFPGNNVTYLELNYNVVYNFRVASAPRVGPYAGGGINFARASVDTPGGNVSNTDVGLNILGGMLFRSAGRLTPFVELKFEAGGGEQFIITGGLLF